VPLKTLSFVPPLSVVSVTTVPAGEVRVMSRFDAFVCLMNVFRSRSTRYVPAPDTLITDVTSGVPVLAIDFGTSVLAK
jgi:hypothetical protein